MKAQLKQPVPSHQSCSEFVISPREIPHLAYIMVRFSNLPATRKHTLVPLLFEAAQSISHLKVKPSPWTTSSQQCQLTSGLHRHIKVESSRGQDHPHISFFLSPFFNMAINLYPQHLMNPTLPGPFSMESLQLPPVSLHIGMFILSLASSTFLEAKGFRSPIAFSKTYNCLLIKDPLNGSH